MLYVNLYGPQLLYSSRKFGQVFLTRTVYTYVHVIIVHVRTTTVEEHGSVLAKVDTL